MEFIRLLSVFIKSERLLKKYKYPPEGEEDALNTIMLQCNKWTEENV